MNQHYSTLFGAPITKLRTGKNLTQWKLADRCSCNPSYIGLLENDMKNPKLSTIFIIAEGLEMKASELVKAIEEYWK